MTYACPLLSSLTSLLQLSWGQPSTLSGKSHVTHPWNRYLTKWHSDGRHEAHLTLQMTPRAWTQACVYGNDLTEAVRQICNYIPVKTSSWILKSLHLSAGRPQAISYEISTAWSTVISEVHCSLQTRLWGGNKLIKRYQEHERKQPLFQGQSFSGVVSARRHNHEQSLSTFKKQPRKHGIFHAFWFWIHSFHFLIRDALQKTNSLYRKYIMKLSELLKG